MTEDIDRYLEERRRNRERYVPQKVQTTRKPTFEEREEIITIPADVWMNSQFGSAFQLFDYIIEANGIPTAALMEVELIGERNTLRLRFTWWEAIVHMEARR